MKPNQVEFVFRPLATPLERTEPRRLVSYTAGWSATSELLRRELAHIGVQRAVIEADLEESQIRQDGLPRADAKFRSQGLRISFEHPEAGALAFSCTHQRRWYHNARAIALTLQRLRQIDWDGCAKRSQQYAGWKALPAPGQELARGDDPVRVILEAAGEEIPDRMDSTLLRGTWRSANEVERKRFLREARRRTHPDAGGSNEAFHRVQEAARSLGLL